LAEKKEKIWRKKEMDERSIARINELYHKSKAEGLTNEEKEEQQKLRKEFIRAVRTNLRGQLNNISLVDADGNVENLSDRAKH
jgi:uncharacterized protein YnzC (UPF0291/DUF896 family)